MTAQNATDTLRLRIAPAKKAALKALAEHQQIDVTKLIIREIDKLLEHDKKTLPEAEAGQGDAVETTTGRLGFRPLPGDEHYLIQYAADRAMKPSTALKLLLRNWRTHHAPIPKHELAALGLTSNQLAALGRNLNQLVKLAQSGDLPLPDELTAVLQETLELTRQASQEVGAVIKANLKSWETDHA